MGAGAGKRVGVEDGDVATQAYQLRPAATAATVVTVLPKKTRTISDVIVAGKECDDSPGVCNASSKPKPRVVDGEAGNRDVQEDTRCQLVTSAAPLQSKSPDEDAVPGGVQLNGCGTSSPSTRPRSRRDDRGDFQSGQHVRLVGLEKASHLNGQEAVTKFWDPEGHRWVIRMTNGAEKRVRTENLQLCSSTGVVNVSGPVAGNGIAAVNSKSIAVTAGGMAVATDANKELETLLLQTNWSAIYQLFHQRFGIAALERLDRGYVVKSAVEMTLSIVAKCFALLRSDPSGRLHCTPLHIAALQSSTEAAEVIVRDLPQLVLQTHTPSHSALCPLHIAILCGAHGIAELLLEGKANPNVRTLHDVCPMHLAATTSRELCQLLLAYGAEPQHRDVMGSTALHYAAAFKQQPAMELLLGHIQGSRLACDVDQKRVTPLHISCALYVSEEDLVLPLALIAHGAKPWQADCHGASPRELVPWDRSSALQRFFEANGDRAQSAAQQWLEERYFTGPGNVVGETEVADASDDEGTRRSETPPAQAYQQQSSLRQPQHGAKHGTFSPAVAPSTSRHAELSEEVERLRKELAEARENCSVYLKERGEVEHLRAKCAMLEQAAANQQKVFDELQALYENERSQHELQLETLQQRQAADRVHGDARVEVQLEAARTEARHSAMKEVEGQQRELNLKFQSMQAELEKARASLAAAEAEQTAAEAKLGVTLLGTSSPQGLGGGNSDLEQRIVELEGEVQRLMTLEEQARTFGEQQRHHLQELRASVCTLCAAHSIVIAGEAPSDLLEPLDAELTRLKNDSSGKDMETSALHSQLQKERDEAAILKQARDEADHRCTRLALERQELETKMSANTLKLETRLRDAELQHTQDMAQLRGELSASQRCAGEAELQVKQLQSSLDKLTAQLQTMEAQFTEEQTLRKKYHNQIQDMKGAIRVFCRFRPMAEREAGDFMALRRADAFTVELARPAPHNDTKPFQFDAVFDSDSTQEDVFADCRELVQSAVDGYNVTIFAYGQTGAGKTHTMYGSPQHPGLAPRSIRALFDVIHREQQRGTKKFKVKTYLVEVYKQDIIDLLADKSMKDKKGGLEVKKDVGRGMMYVEGVTEKAISSPEELMATLAEGEKRRHVAATKMNSASSRSHLLLSIIIECMVKDTEQVMYGKITLCDLAGSERPKKSEVSGDGLKEAIEINKSLSALGDVIEALTKNSKSVPYRNHKLTMLMQDSLGGSAKTLMFVNCSPAGSNAEETQMSLKWASRARQVTNDVKRNADSKEVARLKQVIAMMSRAENAEIAHEDVQGEHLDGSNMDMKMALNATMRAR